MKKLIAVLSLLLSFSAFGNNYVVDAGAVPNSPDAPFLQVFTHEVGGFFDTVNFSITEKSLSSSVSPLNLSLGKMEVLGITNLSYQIWDNSHPDGVISYGIFSGNNVTNIIGLTALGDYHIDISGTASGSAGGVYSVALLTTAVPEPETYSLLLVGLGLLGFAARTSKRAPPFK